MGSEIDLADAIARAAANAGTRLAFGVPGGGSNLALVEAFEANAIDFVLCHGETAGVIMAATVAELTGVPGLALATRGPGAISATNGAAHALLDRSPVVIVTDAIARADRARISHQRIDHTSAFKAVAKTSLEIGGPHAPRTADSAFRHALTPPWGPVHLDTLHDAGGSCEDTQRAGPITTSVPSTWRALLSTAARPLLLVGVGARGCGPAISSMVASTRIPALVTYKAKGLVPEDLESFVGLLTGATLEAPALESADLILCVGLDPVELIPGPWTAQAPLLSLTPWHIEDRYFGQHDELVADPNLHLGTIARELGDASWDCPSAELAISSPSEVGIMPTELVRAVRQAAPRGTIATVDAGAHMLVAMPLWTAYAPGEALISSGLATMGFALPAAIGAALARPEQRVVCFTGDGGLGMCAAELEVLARRHLNVLVVVFNDSCLSLIDIKQRHRAGGTAVTYQSTDFSKVAQGFGVRARVVPDRRTLDLALREWNLGGSDWGPCLLDVHVDASQYPAVLKQIRGT